MWLGLKGFHFYILLIFIIICLIDFKGILCLYVLFLSFLSSQVFSEYSYAGTNQTAMVGSVSANVSNENGSFNKHVLDAIL